MSTILSSSRRCSLCRGEFRDDLPCRLCRECWERLPLWNGHTCSLCGKPLMSFGLRPAEVVHDRVHCCDCCDRTTFINGTTYIGLYAGYLREAIRNMKYRGFAYLGTGLGSILGEAFAASHSSRFRGIVVPIPLHPRRLAERGFNQAESIARGFSRTLGARLVTGALEKARETRDQKQLRASLRAQNVRGVFSVAAASAVVGRDIALIDDVMTTGSTANEAARVLKSGGAGRVFTAVAATGLGQLCDCRCSERIPPPSDE